MKPSNRLQNLPPYLFADLDKQKSEIIAKGKDLIDMSVGNPDLSPPHDLVEAIKSALDDARVHRYPEYIGSLKFRETCSRWLARRHQAQVSPDKEVMALIGSKEGLMHMVLGMVNPGDVVLVPSPGYPLYAQATIIADGVTHFMPLKQENSYLPVFEDIPENVLKETKIMFLNYPNNPTSACATRECFEAAVNLARKYDFVVCHDAAYIEMYANSEPPLSILSIPDAKEVAVEFHSFSKTFSVAGWRIAFAAGNKDVLSALAKMKSNVDSGAFMAVERAASYAMENLEEHIVGLNSVYMNRRKIFVRVLQEIGFHVWPSNASFYIWAKIPDVQINPSPLKGKGEPALSKAEGVRGGCSIDFCKHLLEKTAVAAAPGNGFGPGGEGFVRFSLTVPTERLKEAADRLAKL